MLASVCIQDNQELKYPKFVSHGSDLFSSLTCPVYLAFVFGILFCLYNLFVTCNIESKGQCCLLKMNCIYHNNFLAVILDL